VVVSRPRHHRGGRLRSVVLLVTLIHIWDLRLTGGGKGGIEKQRKTSDAASPFSSDRTTG
jgi:hypothetical protein